MIDYAVTNPATGEQIKTYPTITDAELEAAIGLAHQTHRELAAIDHRRRAREAGAPRRRAPQRAARAAGRDHRPRDGQAHGAGAGRDRLLRRHLRVLRGQRAGPDEGRADPAPRGRGLRDHPPQLAGRDPRDHAVELPDLPGRAVRRPGPDHRERRAPEARPAVPRDRRGAPADLPRRRLPRGRLRQHLRHERSDRPRHRRPARAGRVGDRLGARRCGGGRDRRPEPEEGRARAGRLRPVHPAQHRRPRCDRRVSRQRPPGQRRPVVQRRQAVRRDRRAVRAVPREVHGRHDGVEDRRPRRRRHRARPAVLEHRGGPSPGSARPRHQGRRQGRRRRRALRQLLLADGADRRHA